MPSDLPTLPIVPPTASTPSPAMRMSEPAPAIPAPASFWTLDIAPPTLEAPPLPPAAELRRRARDPALLEPSRTHLSYFSCRAWDELSACRLLVYFAAARAHLQNAWRQLVHVAAVGVGQRPAVAQGEFFGLPALYWRQLQILLSQLLCHLNAVSLRMGQLSAVWQSSRVTHTTLSIHSHPSLARLVRLPLHPHVLAMISLDGVNVDLPARLELVDSDLAVLGEPLVETYECAHAQVDQERNGSAPTQRADGR